MNYYNNNNSNNTNIDGNINNDIYSNRSPKNGNNTYLMKASTTTPNITPITNINSTKPPQQPSSLPPTTNTKSISDSYLASPKNSENYNEMEENTYTNSRNIELTKENGGGVDNNNNNNNNDLNMNNYPKNVMINNEVPEDSDNFLNRNEVPRPSNTYINSNNNNLTYNLIIRQQPKNARCSGLTDRDRRPIDPPPIVQLTVFDSENNPNSAFLYSSYFLLYASLITEKKQSIDNDYQELHVNKEKTSRSLIGSVSSSMNRLKDFNNYYGGFFIFHDISVRCEGIYRLKFSLYEMHQGMVTYRTSKVSDKFVVYSPKLFPGMQESSPLARFFAEQGLKIRIRKEMHISRRRQSRRAKDFWENDNGEILTEENHPFKRGSLKFDGAAQQESIIENQEDEQEQIKEKKIQNLDNINYKPKIDEYGNNTEIESLYMGNEKKNLMEYGPYSNNIDMRYYINNRQESNIISNYDRANVNTNINANKLKLNQDDEILSINNNRRNDNINNNRNINIYNLNDQDDNNNYYDDDERGSAFIKYSDIVHHQPPPSLLPSYNMPDKNKINGNMNHYSDLDNTNMNIDNPMNKGNSYQRNTNNRRKNNNNNDYNEQNNNYMLTPYSNSNNSNSESNFSLKSNTSNRGSDNFGNNVGNNNNDEMMKDSIYDKRNPISPTLNMEMNMNRIVNNENVNNKNNNSILLSKHHHHLQPYQQQQQQLHSEIRKGHASNYLNDLYINNNCNKELLYDDYNDGNNNNKPLIKENLVNMYDKDYYYKRNRYTNEYDNHSMGGSSKSNKSLKESGSSDTGSIMDKYNYNMDEPNLLKEKSHNKIRKNEQMRYENMLNNENVDIDHSPSSQLKYYNRMKVGGSMSHGGSSGGSSSNEREPETDKRIIQNDMVMNNNKNNMKFTNLMNINTNTNNVIDNDGSNINNVHPHEINQRKVLKVNRSETDIYREKDYRLFNANTNINPNNANINNINNNESMNDLRKMSDMRKRMIRNNDEDDYEVTLPSINEYSKMCLKRKLSAIQYVENKGMGEQIPSFNKRRIQDHEFYDNFGEDNINNSNTNKMMEYNAMNDRDTYSKLDMKNSSNSRYAGDNEQLLAYNGNKGRRNSAVIDYEHPSRMVNMNQKFSSSKEKEKGIYYYYDTVRNEENIKEKIMNNRSLNEKFIIQQSSPQFENNKRYQELIRLNNGKKESKIMGNGSSSNCSSCSNGGIDNGMIINNNRSRSNGNGNAVIPRKFSSSSDYNDKDLLHYENYKRNYYSNGINNRDVIGEKNYNSMTNELMDDENKQFYMMDHEQQLMNNEKIRYQQQHHIMMNNHEMFMMDNNKNNWPMNGGYMRYEEEEKQQELPEQQQGQNKEELEKNRQDISPNTLNQHLKSQANYKRLINLDHTNTTLGSNANGNRFDHMLLENDNDRENEEKLKRNKYYLPAPMSLYEMKKMSEKRNYYSNNNNNNNNNDNNNFNNNFNNMNNMKNINRKIDDDEVFALKYQAMENNSRKFIDEEEKLMNMPYDNYPFEKGMNKKYEEKIIQNHSFDSLNIQRNVKTYENQSDFSERKPYGYKNDIEMENNEFAYSPPPPSSSSSSTIYNKNIINNNTNTKKPLRNNEDIGNININNNGNMTDNGSNRPIERKRSFMNMLIKPPYREMHHHQDIFNDSQKMRFKEMRDESPMSNKSTNSSIISNSSNNTLLPYHIMNESNINKKDEKKIIYNSVNGNEDEDYDYNNKNMSLLPKGDFQTAKDYINNNNNNNLIPIGMGLEGKLMNRNSHDGSGNVPLRKPTIDEITNENEYFGKSYKMVQDKEYNSGIKSMSPNSAMSINNISSLDYNNKPNLPPTINKHISLEEPIPTTVTATMTTTTTNISTSATPSTSTSTPISAPIPTLFPSVNTTEINTNQKSNFNGRKEFSNYLVTRESPSHLSPKTASLHQNNNENFKKMKMDNYVNSNDVQE